ncbi:MAG: alpha/beta fold hydrolase [Oscillatoriales cyanobacterium]|nr:MAG: alpha/beta fold hydrolase [Oscillatoriales cyanobacterium]
MTISGVSEPRSPHWPWRLGTLLATLATTIATLQAAPRVAAQTATAPIAQTSGPGAQPAAPAAPALDASFNPTFEPKNCPFTLPPEFARETVRCGMVTVPERHTNPTGKTIRLGVAILKSKSATPQPDPLVMAQGGPGASMLELLPAFLPSLAGMRDRDIILFDQRGTRYSEPFLFCPEIYDFKVKNARFPDSPALRDRYQAAVAGCRDRLKNSGVDLAAYNSLESAADVPMVVRAAGYEGQFNFYGVSYGTMLAQHLMRDFPDRLRSVVMDSVAPLDQSFIVQLPRNTNRALRRFFEACRRDRVCGATYTTLEQDFLDAIGRLRSRPLLVKLPNYGELQDLLEGRILIENLNPDRLAVPVLIDGDGFISAVSTAFYSSASIPKLPQALRETRQNNYAGILRVLPLLLFTKGQADGVYNSVMCSEDGGFSMADVNISGVYPEIAPALQQAPEELLRTCQTWQVPPLEPKANQPIQSAVPTLLLSGELDQVTPPEFAERVAQGLSRHYRQVFPGLSHAVFGSADCVSRIMGDFLRSPEQGPNGSCVGQMRVAFDVPKPLRFTPTAVSTLGINTVIPAGWRLSMQGLAPVWSEFDESGFATGRVLAVSVAQQSASEVLRSLPYPTKAVGERRYRNRRWQLYTIDNPSLASIVALHTRRGKTYVVAIDSDSLWHRDAVLEGVLSNFRIQ